LGFSGNFGHPAAQTQIVNQRFLDILAMLPQFFVIVRPKHSIFMAIFSCYGPETDLGWPPLVSSFFITLKSDSATKYENFKQFGRFFQKNQVF
jgi:hypothetical protein